jgi:hypothetical protein
VPTKERDVTDLRIVHRDTLDESPTLRNTLVDLLRAAEASLYEDATSYLRGAARHGQRAVRLSSLCAASGLGRQAALEWLSSEGIVVRTTGRWFWKCEWVVLNGKEA